MEKCVKQLAKEFPGIKLFYSKNVQRLGYYGNCRQPIMSTPGDYVWCLGDAMYVDPGCFSEVFKKLQSNPDAIILNFDDRCNVKINKTYESIFM